MGKKFKYESAEPLWPRQIIVLVPAGFLVGLILGQCRFDDPNPLRSGWTWLAVFGAILASLGWSALRAQYRVARQIRLGILLSLLAHVGLLFAMESVSLGVSSNNQLARDYTPWHRRDAEQQVFLGEAKVEVIPRHEVQPPVDVDSLKAAVLERSPRQEQPTIEPPVETPLTPLPTAISPSTISRVEPAQLNRADEERAIPLAADETPRLQRQVADAPLASSAAVAVPDVAAPVAQEPSAPNAQPMASDRPLSVGNASALESIGLPSVASAPSLERAAQRSEAAPRLATSPSISAIPRRRAAATPSVSDQAVPPVPELPSAGTSQQAGAPGLTGGVGTGSGLTGGVGTGSGPTVGVGPAASSGRLTGTTTPPLVALPGGSGAGAGTGVDTALPAGGGPSRRIGSDVATVTHLQEDRFINRRVGGVPSINAPVRDRAEAFRARRPLGRGPGNVGSVDLGSKAEDAIQAGLEFLVRYQLPDGRWSLHSFRGATESDAGLIHSDAAATALALLSFLGAGYDHYDDKYQATVRGGLDFLLRNQKPNGDLYIAQDAESNKSAWLYSHAIATLALCESYGMTGDKRLQEPAQRAINFIVETQNQSTGGWRYTPGVSADTSVSGWQLMALKSGELSGLKVPRETLDKIKGWLDYAQVEGSGGSQYLYNPGRPASQDPRDTRRPTMTSVGLLMRLYLGWNRQTPALVTGAKTIQASLPEMCARGAWARDTYYWYYATQVMYHMGGDYWKTWQDRLHPLLVSTQVQTGDARGSWDPTNPVPDRWGQHGGRIYVTTLNLLSLEVTYRNLPIYESTGK
jgi:hypothetical protein